jgi:hypothetical protein
MANPADDYWKKEDERFLLVQAAKRVENPEKVKLAELFSEMKDAHYWYYEKRH